MQIRTKLIALRLQLISAVMRLFVAALPMLAHAAQLPTAPAGYFHTYRLDATTYAISEPKYWQENVSYLLLGSKRALLFDTGPGIYSIRQEVSRLTKLPVLVIPTHLHFDHVGGIKEFSEVGLIDLPELRAEEHDGTFTESVDEFMVSAYPWSFAVKEWIKDGTSIELGNRAVVLISTPGHTPNAVSLADSSHKKLFTGDIINREVTLVDLPGADIHVMAGSLHRIQSFGRPDYKIHEAHSEKPILWSELVQVTDGVETIAGGRARFTQSCLANVPQHRYDVAGFPFLLPANPNGAADFPKWTSATQELDWLATCK